MKVYLQPLTILEYCCNLFIVFVQYTFYLSFRNFQVFIKIEIKTTILTRFLVIFQT